MRPDQLDALVTLSAPTLSPDGAVAVVSATRPSFEADAYVGQLWRFSTAGAARPRRITRGRSDTAPQFSPDGAVIAFLRSVEGTPQLAIVDADGGEPRVVTNAPLGVTGFAWSPDSRRIAFTAAMPEHGRYGTVEGVSARQESPRRILGNKWRFNGRGYITDKPVGIYVLDVPGDEEPWIEPIGRAARAWSAAASPSRSLSDEHGEESKRGEADRSGGVGFDSASGSAQPAGLGGGSAQPSRAGVFTQPADGEARAHRHSARSERANGVAESSRASAGPEGPRILGGTGGFPEALLVTPAGADTSSPVFSPDGDCLYFVAALHEGADEDLRQSVYRVALDGVTGPEHVAPRGPGLSLFSPVFAGESLLALGKDYGESGLDFVAKLIGVFGIAADGAAERLTDAESEEFGSHESFVAPAERGTVLVPRRDRGGDALVRFDATGAVGEALPHGPRIVTGAAEKNGTLVVTYSDTATSGEVAVVRDGEIVTLSDFAAALPAPVAATEFTAVGDDGYPVHGWVYTPDGEGPHPVLLNIHGGPFADYSWGYFDEAQVYARAGYAVVQCNPRGSQGYGRAHGHAIKERMGTLDMQDVLTFLDGAVAEFDELDGERVGILGGSYGGYLTAWTIAHEHRFAAAMVERGYLDPLAFIGVSDIGWYFSEEYVGRDPEHARTQSPQAVAGNVRTPTLVMHSEEDWRCPPDQAQRYFASLRRAGVETEMLLFPAENHELSRSGTPWHRRERFDAILEWFARYLPASASPRDDEG